MRCKRILMMVAMTVALGMMSGSAWAGGRGGGGKGGGKGGKGAGGGAGGTGGTATSGATIQADQASITAIKTKLWTAVTQTDDYVAAKRAYDAAQAAYDAACKVVLDKLAKSPEYQAAVAKKKKASDALDNFEETDSSNPDDRSNLAEAKMDAGAVVTRMEGDAEAADDDCAKAKAALVTAQQAIDKFKTDFDASLSSNTEYTAAEDKLKSDQSAAKSANASKTTSGRGTTGGTGG